MGDRWQEVKTAYANSIFAAKELQRHFPSDNIEVGEGAFLEMKKFREEIIGGDEYLLGDIIWSQNVPLMDFTATVEGNRQMRFIVFEDALENIHDVPNGATALVGAIQEMGFKHFWMFGVIKGTTDMTISDEHYDENGNVFNSSIDIEHLRELMKLWHSIQLCLLHPKLKEVIMGSPKMRKERTRVKDNSGKRVRKTYYVKHHVISERQIKSGMSEHIWKCKCWYVIGHWRTLKNGNTIWINGYWKGELRALKRNVDNGRERKIV